MIFSRKNTKANRPGLDSVGALYDQHAPWLLAVCLRYTGNIENAEDVLHDGFIKIFRSIDSFKNDKPGSIEGWMSRIVVNTALNYIRDRKKERIFTDLEQLPGIAEEEDEQEIFSGCGLSKDQLMDLICQLPLGYRTVFNLYVMEDYTHREIAGMLGISENTSKSQLSKARNMLRKRITSFQQEYKYEKAESNR